jgi:ATP-dependent NAD(P)H-hydrate dehydratase
LLKSDKKIVLTPNQVEFSRLWEKFMKSETPVFDSLENGTRWRDSNDYDVQHVVLLAQKLGVSLLVKGKTDVITDGKAVITVSEDGSGKRVGGQGDVLAGVLATCVCQALKNEIEIIRALACASMIVRKSANIAFRKKQWGLTCPDIIKCLPKAVGDVLGNSNI